MLLTATRRRGGATGYLGGFQVVPDSIAVFILAENRLLREALARLLSKKNDVRVAGACAFSPQVIEQIAGAEPDILLADSSASALPDLQLIPEVRSALPGLKVIMIGMEDGRDPFMRAVRDGVAGYVLKDASAMEVVTAVRSVANGEAACPPHLCLHLFDYVASERQQSSTYHVRHNLGLTRRELQLVRMVERGLTNKEIASQLNLSEQTIKNHIHRMLRKVGASDRLTAVELCRAPGVQA
jgi:DNA-binding NarL/FixJ family response regulator